MRTVEHSKRCLAKAMICAVENFRDAEAITLTEFVEFAQRDVLTTAQGYLADGLLDCSCALLDRTGAEITNPYYRCRFTDEFAVVTTTGVTYQSDPESGNPLDNGRTLEEWRAERDAVVTPDYSWAD